MSKNSSETIYNYIGTWPYVIPPHTYYKIGNGTSINIKPHCCYIIYGAGVYGIFFYGVILY